jgi:lipopolysaccharide assembly protein A
MRIIYAAILLVLVAAAAVFCVQNLGSVTIRYLGWQAMIPLPLLVILVHLLGMISGWGVLSFLRRTIRVATEAKK